MKDYRAEYQRWMAEPTLDEKTRAELAAIAGDEKEIMERFHSSLTFGTGGLRGIMRAGTNGMNDYTVAQATQGLACLIKKNGKQRQGVVIATDTRNHSEDFARVAASVLAANGVWVYLFDGPRPTPELSFALRELGAAAGINLTASHNPKEYNGYKVYWDDGGQLPPDHAKTVAEQINSIDLFCGTARMEFEQAKAQGYIRMVGDEMDEKYLTVLLDQRISPETIPNAADRLKVVYTPLHGAGKKLVPEVLRRAGIKHLYCVQEQMTPDGDFPTVDSPNPENKSCFALAIQIAKEHGCDLLIGTDPDSDRCGVVVRTKHGEYVALTGNQTGALLLDYIIERRRDKGRLPANACAIKSIVTTKLVDRICEKQGIALVQVLTGFKFIGEKIKEFETTGEYAYIFGFEESYGYLSGTYARDKDGVCASMLVAEMAAFYSLRGMSLHDALMALYEKYGYFAEDIENIVLPGADGLEKTQRVMRTLRDAPVQSIAGVPVASVGDYSNGVIRFADGTERPTCLPSSDVLYYTLDTGDAVVIRPSGTEPKIKIYYLVQAQEDAGSSAEPAAAAADTIAAYKKAFRELLPL